MAAGVLLAPAAISCGGQRDVTSVDTGANPQPVIGVRHDVPVTGQPPQNALPKAIVYRTNRDVGDHVAVRLNPERTALVTFPAPSDLSGSSTPLELADGWLLDRRGTIGENTVFLTYTYEEYAALPSAPSPSQLMSAIISDAKVTEVWQIDLVQWEALSDTAAVNRIIAAGFPKAVRVVP